MLSGPPRDDIVVAASIGRIAAGTEVVPVWQNEAGGLTFELADLGKFVKWSPLSCADDFDDEAARLRWADQYIDVPGVVATGSDGEGSWLVTTALAGSSAVAERWKAEPATAVRAIGEGLRAMHDALPVEMCPFESWPPEVADTPGIDRLVVCHGDPCAPNTLVAKDGSCAGHVDFGALGVADRWADLAIATWSTEWNYGPGWENPLLEAYRIEPDPERTAFYRQAWGPPSDE